MHLSRFTLKIIEKVFLRQFELFILCLYFSHKNASWSQFFPEYFSKMKIEMKKI